MIQKLTNWNDFRYLLAVADQGSLSAAARHLNVSQPTVSRRLAELEEQLQAALFDRTLEGYRLTEPGKRVCAQARLLGEQARRIETDARSAQAQVTERVMIASTEGLAYSTLTPLLAEFQRANTDIHIELSIAFAPADLMRREVDIALRVGDPKTSELVGRRLCAAYFGLFAGAAYLQRYGRPMTLEDLDGHMIIESTADLADLPQARWLREAATPAQVFFSCNSMMNQLRAAQEGLGLLALPTYLAAEAAGLTRILSNSFNLEADIWLLTQRQMKDLPHIRTVLDFLGDNLANALQRKFEAVP